MENKNNLPWIILTIFVLVILIMIGGFLSLNYFFTNYFSKSSTINVEGTSDLTVQPDLARVWVGVSVLKPNANDAQAEENKIINSIIKGLLAKGYSDADIETENLNLYEEKTWTEKGEKSLGWRASQTLKIKTKDLTKVGDIVDISVNNGANQINNIEFYLSPAKEKEYKENAIADATKNAKDKAETIAESLNARLIKIQSVSESNFNYFPYNYQMKNNIASDAAVDESATVMPKDVTVNARISLVYEIK